MPLLRLRKPERSSATGLTSGLKASVQKAVAEAEKSVSQPIPHAQHCLSNAIRAEPCVRSRHRGPGHRGETTDPAPLPAKRAGLKVRTPPIAGTARGGPPPTGHQCFRPDARSGRGLARQARVPNPGGTLYSLQATTCGVSRRQTHNPSETDLPTTEIPGRTSEPARGNGLPDPRVLAATRGLQDPLLDDQEVGREGNDSGTLQSPDGRKTN